MPFNIMIMETFFYDPESCLSLNGDRNCLIVLELWFDTDTFILDSHVVTLPAPKI